MLIPIFLAALICIITFSYGYLLTPTQKTWTKNTSVLILGLLKILLKRLWASFLHFMLDMAGPRSNARVIIWPSRKMFSIIYSFEGSTRTITVPYDKTILPYTSDVKVFAKYKEEMLDITQLPGMSYNFTGRDLGTGIILVDGDEQRMLGLDEKILAV